ncbi:MAG: hypothetical protein QXR44_00600 [Thermoproteota archaeon]
MPAFQEAESLAGDYTRQQIEEELRKQKEKLKDLISRRKLIKEEIIEITKQIDENTTKRNEINQQIKKLKEEIAQLRNSEKSLRDEIEQKRVVVKSRSKKIKISEREARAYLSKLEWRLATEHLDPKEEAELVREIERARMLLREVESIVGMKKNMEDFENKIGDIKSMIIQKSNEKAKLVEASNLYHTKIKELLEERRIKRDELSRLDAEIEEARKKKDELFMKIVELDAKSYLAKMRRMLMFQEEQAKRLKMEEAIRSKLASDAQEKLKRGETLDWEEFKALIEAQSNQFQGR